MSKRREKESHKLVPLPESVYEEFKQSVESVTSVKSYKDSNKAEEEIVRSLLSSSLKESAKIMRFEGKYTSFGNSYIAQRTLDKLGIIKLPLSVLMPLLKEVRRVNSEAYTSFLEEVERFTRGLAVYLKNDGLVSDHNDMLEFLKVLTPYLELLNNNENDDQIEAVFKAPLFTEEVSDFAYRTIKGFLEAFGYSIVSFSSSGGLVVVKVVKGKVITAGE
ncbi:MAG: hypothetical protein RQ879_02100 [Sulfolobales archaeon]|nr:hypothetical protein [Sulfolobales archaeon]